MTEVRPAREVPISPAACTDALDGVGVGGGAHVDDGASESIVGVADDFDEAVDVPACALAAAVLGDEDDEGACPRGWRLR